MRGAQRSEHARNCLALLSLRFDALNVWVWTPIDYRGQLRDLPRALFA